MDILDFGTVVDCCGFVGGKLVPFLQAVVILGEHGGNIFIHGEAASLFGLIPR